MQHIQCAAVAQKPPFPKVPAHNETAVKHSPPKKQRECSAFRRRAAYRRSSRKAAAARPPLSGRVRQDQAAAPAGNGARGGADQYGRRPDGRRPAGVGRRSRSGGGAGDDHAGLRKEIYRSSRGRGPESPCRLRAGENSFLAMAARRKPSSLISSALSRTLEVDFGRLGTGAESSRRPIFGRTAMGERVRQARVPRPLACPGRRSTRPCGGSGPSKAVSTSNLAHRRHRNCAIAVATRASVDPDAETRLPAVRDVIGASDGASAWTRRDFWQASC